MCVLTFSQSLTYPPYLGKTPLLYSHTVGDAKVPGECSYYYANGDNAFSHLAPQHK